MSKARVVSAFPGTGKSHLFRDPKNLIILDSDSSQYSWAYDDEGNKSRNPDFPDNYITHIKDAVEEADLILVSTHKEVRDALVANGIHFDLVFPDVSLKDEYIQRYKDRGSDEGFIKMMENNFEKFIGELRGQDGCTKLVLDEPSIFLSDLGYTKELGHFIVTNSLKSVVNIFDINDIKEFTGNRLEGLSATPPPYLKGASIDYVSEDTPITTMQAIKHLGKQLREDDSYYESWKSNIAMSFQDCYHQAEDKTNIHQIANTAADHFLKLLIN